MSGDKTSAQSTTTPAPASSKPPAAGVAITASGDILTGPDSWTLYFNTVDTASKITCVDACAKQ